MSEFMNDDGKSRIHIFARYDVEPPYTDMPAWERAIYRFADWIVENLDHSIENLPWVKAGRAQFEEDKKKWAETARRMKENFPEHWARAEAEMRELDYRELYRRAMAEMETDRKRRGN